MLVQQTSSQTTEDPLSLYEKISDLLLRLQSDTPVLFYLWIFLIVLFVCILFKLIVPDDDERFKKGAVLWFPLILWSIALCALLYSFKEDVLSVSSKALKIIEFSGFVFLFLASLLMLVPWLMKFKQSRLLKLSDRELFQKTAIYHWRYFATPLIIVSVLLCLFWGLYIRGLG